MNVPHDHEATAPAAPAATVRRAVPADAGAVASLLHDAFREFRPRYTPGAFAATAVPPEQVRRRMQEGPVWVAVLDGEVVATVAAVPRGPALYVRGMAVLPSARGRRIAEALLAEVERFAAERGYPRLELMTAPFLSSALRLYERYGFRRTGRWENFHGTSILVMEKVVALGPGEHELITMLT